MADVALVAGYIVRCPLAGYAWQALHYVAGLRALGFDAYFYEDTAYYGDCFDPVSGEMGAVRPSAIAFAADFFAQHGFGDRWIFWDAPRDRYAGRGRDEARAARPGAPGGQPGGGEPTAARRRHAPRLHRHRSGVTQIQAERDPGLRGAARRVRRALQHRREHRPLGLRGPGGSLELATDAPTGRPRVVGTAGSKPDAAFTTIGRWDERRRVQQLGGARYSWSKRDQWLRFLDVPRRAGAAFELAMDVDKNPGDTELLATHGWRMVDPLAVSTDAGRYRDYIRGSLGEFSVAKELNVRLATGWFSDRSACYLAAGRPVVVQDTGFRTTLPTGAGLLTFTTLEEAVDAVRTVTADWPLHSAAARRIAEQYFAAKWVLADLLDRAGV
jgi:hypothetical protein